MTITCRFFFGKYIQNIVIHCNRTTILFTPLWSVRKPLLSYKHTPISHQSGFCFSVICLDSLSRQPIRFLEIILASQIFFFFFSKKKSIHTRSDQIYSYIVLFNNEIENDNIFRVGLFIFMTGIFYYTC